MTRSNSFTVALAAALLAGCAVPTSLPQGTTTLPGVGTHGRLSRGASVAKQDLLYVANSNGEVTIYRYWLHSVVGVLTTLTQPMGECVDAKSNVYITDYAAKKIVEFAHGATKSTKSFDDSPDSPYMCSVDRASGNLAVANYNPGSTQGDIAIWSNGTGSPKRYSDPLVYTFQDCAYDGGGDLLVSNGIPAYNKSVYFAWLPKNGSKLIDIKVPGPNPSWVWRAVEGIQWDGKYFVIDDYSLYRLSLIHGQAYYVGMTSLEHPGYPLAIYDNKPGSQGTQVVGGYSGDSYSWVYYWQYPYGGPPIYQLEHGIDRPLGITVSLRTQ
jgi:hypothetical protein